MSGWAADRATFTTAAQATSAAGLPAGFADFLAERLTGEDARGCTTTQIDVIAVHPQFVFGAEESDCGGGQMIWGVEGGVWNYVKEFQDAMPCKELLSADIPTGVPELRCVDEDFNAVDY